MAQSLNLKRDNFFLLALTLAVSALAVVSWLFKFSSGLEAVSFVTGAICVWLTVKQSTWNFPISLVNVATFSVVFFEARLFADAGLQVVYFILTLVGWYLWLFGGAQRTPLKVSRTSSEEIAILVGVLVALTALLSRLLTLYGGSAFFLDALTTSMSLVAQWLLNKKKLESWVFWIVVDIIYVPLYLYKGLYLTALLYTVFLAMAVIGYKEWKAAQT